MKQHSLKVLLCFFLLLLAASVALHFPKTTPDSEGREVNSPNVAAAEPSPSESHKPAATEMPGLPILKPSRDVLWQQPMPEPSFAHFKEWTVAYAKAQTAEERSTLEVQGQALAQARLT